MDKKELKKILEEAEKNAFINGWDFSCIEGKYQQGELPWDYKKTIYKYLKGDMKILDCDTGGGEFLLSLNHPFYYTSATEGYLPNVELCKEKLLPLGIDFKFCDNPENIPFDSEYFDIIINRHGSYDVKEVYRLLKKDGLFITQQVGSNNDRELVEILLPDVKLQFPDHTLEKQKQLFKEEGFDILEASEAYVPICFFDIGAFVWFAKIIEWEFVGFSVEKHFENLFKIYEIINEKGKIEGMAHRFLIVAKK